jgi:hypothetical protein
MFANFDTDVCRRNILDSSPSGKVLVEISRTFDETRLDICTNEAPRAFITQRNSSEQPECWNQAAGMLLVHFCAMLLWPLGI